MTDPADCVDLFVVGGGINGAGIARDAAGRGLSVVLCEQDDLGAHTSSRSGKLVHGGLRYLEYYEFRLVREALIEREVLLESAPHIIWPLRFVLPHSADDRPAWLIRLGLFLYDHLGGRKRLPGTRVLRLASAPEGKVVKARYRKAFEYSDCWVDDARLVILNALDAQARGAQILNRTRFVQARRVAGRWQIETQDSQSGAGRRFAARALVNAAGPWVNQVIDALGTVATRRQVRLVKGSHIVVKKFWDGPHAYLIQHTDKRVIFINPYETDKALIGTTDIPYHGEPAAVAIEPAEIDYLLGAVNRYFTVQLSAASVEHTFSGVRPLYDDQAANPTAVTRDYVFDFDDAQGQAPVLSVFGGKITTFRRLAEHALEKLQPYFPAIGRPWTACAHLPGGDIRNGDFAAFVAELGAAYPWLPTLLLNHYARLYGTRSHALLDGARALTDLGQCFGGQLYAREALFLLEREWARTVDDILHRRTKHGLHLNTDQIGTFTRWLAHQGGAGSTEK